MNSKRRAAIVSPLRTPVGRFQGTLAPLNAGELGAVILKALVERSGIDPARVNDVVFSQGYGNAEAPAIGHWSWLAAGLPLEVPGYQLDRRCGSGLQAVVNAAMMIEAGHADVVVAGGCESMSNVEHYTTALRGGVKAGNLELWDRLTRGRLMSQPVERNAEVAICRCSCGISPRAASITSMSFKILFCRHITSAQKVMKMMKNGICRKR